jgi:integrase
MVDIIGQAAGLAAQIRHAWRMIRRRTLAAGVHAPISNHSFRATGITAYLANGGVLEHAQERRRMRAHERRNCSTGRKSD